MDPMWTAIVLIVLIAMISEIFKYNIKMKHKEPSKQDVVSTEKIAQLEKRIESLESLIIDLDREKRFRDLK